MDSTAPHNTAPPAIGFGEFVTMIAALMAVSGLAIDAMLPALPHIATALHIVNENQRQWVMTAFLLGFGVGQIVYGSLSDRYGRKPVLLASLVAYVACSLLAAFATDFTLFLAARAIQGVAAAASRVLGVSIVRDRYSGRQMARVMSLVMIVSLVVPIVAPSLGTILLLIAPWRWMFGVLAGFAAIVLAWTVLRLPETLPPERRRPLSIAALADAGRRVLGGRESLGYMLAQAVAIGGLFGFINSAQQIFFETFSAPKAFPLVFACIAGSMAAASLLNSRIVVRVGMRRVSHAALLGLIAICAVHLLIAATGHETIASFAITQALTMACFGLVMGNFGAMAMEPLGSIAGTASSIQGFITTIGGSLIGFAIGQSFDGTTVPLVLGYLICDLVVLALVLFTERGRLFSGHHDAEATAPRPEVRVGEAGEPVR